jgi:hypothetical protein
MVLLTAIIKDLWKSRSHRIKEIKQQDIDRFEQARLLLYRLNDEDIDCPMAKRHLNTISDYVLINCINLFQAYFYIILKAKALSERGYEISKHWIEASDSVSDHLNNYCVPCLSPDDNYSFECQLPRLFTVALNFHRRSLSVEV